MQNYPWTLLIREVEALTCPRVWTDGQGATQNGSSDDDPWPQVSTEGGRRGGRFSAFLIEG